MVIEPSKSCLVSDFGMNYIENIEITKLKENELSNYV